VIGKIRAFLSRPFMQVVLLLVLAGAANSASHRLLDAYLAGPTWSLGFVVWHVITIALVILFMLQCDMIERQLKALRDIAVGYKQWKARREQGES
jgi:hypothetical protein